MLKFIAATLLVAGVANAGTVTLQSTYCGAYRVCADVPNDASLNIDINTYTGGYQPGVTVTIDGIDYVSAAGNDSTITNLDLVDNSGNHVLLNATFSAHSKYISSGRAHYYRHWWTLDSGSVFMP